MAKCPFATFDEITGAVGPFSGGPFKIVHHTTEGSTYAGARAAYKAHRSEPHFSVAGDQIFQHVDTGLAARALKNPPGGVETNRDSAVQIEVVGFAGSAKDVTTLRTVAKLCRWIENEHGVPQKWPNGRLRVSTNGRDPGGHNRNAANWDADSGHYGHSQVPENDHWDPAYSAAELAIVTPDAVFDPHDELEAAPASMIAVREAELAPAPVAVDVIVARVLAGLAAIEASPLGRPASRVTVHVAVGGTEVDVVLEASDVGGEGSVTASSPPRRHTKRKAQSKGKTRRRSKR